MSDDLTKKIKMLKNNMPDRSYEVGYGKPPTATRFTKGKSGNPRGRPKGSKNQRPAMNEERLGDIIMQEAYREIKVKDGSKEIRIPTVQAIVRSMSINALRGDHRSQKTFTDLVIKKETKDKIQYDEFLKAMIDYKLDWEYEIEHHKLMGLKPPEPVPHPDHIEINMATGQVRITGPFTKEEKVKWDKLKKRRDAAREAIKIYEADLKDPKNKKYKKSIEDEIAFERRLIAIISERIPE